MSDAKQSLSTTITKELDKSFDKGAIVGVESILICFKDMRKRGGNVACTIDEVILVIEDAVEELKASLAESNEGGK